MNISVLNISHTCSVKSTDGSSTLFFAGNSKKNTYSFEPFVCFVQAKLLLITFEFGKLTVYLMNWYIPV